MNITSKEYFTFNVDNSAILVGRTGSGKTEFVKSYIRRIEKTYTPEQMKYVIFDLKDVEFNTHIEDGAKEEYLLHPVLSGSQKIEELYDYLDKLADIIEDRAKRNTTKPFIFIYIEECDMAYSNPQRFSDAIKRINNNLSRANAKLIYSTSRPSKGSFPDGIKETFDIILTSKLKEKTDREYLGAPYSVTYGFPEYGFLVIDNKTKPKSIY